jgi:drug/metabolite transporter (DMT)-like permease
MTTANLLRLLLLAAIWGGSFLFMRIAAPVLGPAVLIECRLLCAALFLAAVAVVVTRRRPDARLDLRRNWKHYFILGFFNSAFPFLLIAFAARTLSASLLAVLNATAPMWGALLGAAWNRQRVPGATIFGLLLGAVGVTLLVGFDSIADQTGASVAIAAALLAAVCYSVASLYARSSRGVDPFANTHGTMWTSAIMVVPALLVFPPSGGPTPGIVAAVVTLGVVCSGVAYLLYFPLIDTIGPTSALSVTFLSPVFGIVWGALFLGEKIGWYTVVGAAVVLVGTALVTGVLPRRRIA